MRLISRLLLLLFGVSCLVLLFIGKCGVHLEIESRAEPLFATLQSAAEAAATLGKPAAAIDPGLEIGHFQELLHQKEAAHRQETKKLLEEIKNLKLKLLDLTKTQGFVNHRGYEDGGAPIAAKTLKNVTSANQGCYDYVRRQINNAEIKKGISLNNEHEIVPFSHFTFNRIYPVELGLGKRVVEKPIGFRRKDLVEVFVRTLDVLNKKYRGRKHYTPDDILEGIFRIEPTTGTHYEVYVKERNTSHSYTKVVLLRPFAAIQVVSDANYHTKELVNIIVPLSGRVDTFQSFVDKFVKVGLKHDRRVHLTVVYFGQASLAEVQATLTRMSREYRFHQVKLLTLNETFSRGKGLQIGAQAWTRGDVLMFMCDVDVAFSAKFLDRCRLNAIAGQRVYYPIVFSLYNPAVVYSLHDKEIPSETDQLLISRDTGFWRDFGYGMTCQYLSDFKKVKGFDEDIVGWGGEDVMLYRKYVRSNYTVVRATDPGVFHIWHEKKCDPQLSAMQYSACIRSRVINEASHEQLGLLAYKDDILQHKLAWKGKTSMPQT